MLLVILGAGASYDSAPSYRPRPDAELARKGAWINEIAYRPPLADELFDDRPDFSRSFQYFHECLPLIANLRHRDKGTTVEQALEAYADEVRAYPARHQHLLAIRYALQMLLRECVSNWHRVHGGVTNYATLIDHIERWRSNYKQVLIVTFNYDTMIEAALGVVRITFNSMKDYVGDERYKLVKVHGSVNWARTIAEPSALTLSNIRMRITEALRLRVADEWQIADGYPTLSATRDGDRIAAVPSMVLPFRSKAVFECPADQQQALADYLPKINKVLVIGWRATEPHFTALLRQHVQGRIWHIVAGSTRAGEATMNALRRDHIGGNFNISPGGFSDFVIKRESYDFLSQT